MLWDIIYYNRGRRFIFPIIQKGTLKLEAIMNEKTTVGEQKIRSLFDAGTFVEIGSYIKRNGADSVYDGVICGYGSIGGKLAFAFVQDSDRLMGALDTVGAGKLEALYGMAIKNGAPVIGIFDSAGAVVLDGCAALSAYGRFMSLISGASGIIPQIAVIDGRCTGMALTAVSMFDISITVKDRSVMYMLPDGGEDALRSAACVGSSEDALALARELVEILPQNNRDCASDMSGDSVTRAVSAEGLTGRGLIEELADNGRFTELFSRDESCVSTGLIFMGGVLCGVIASNTKSKSNGKLCPTGARIAAELISLCDRFSIPVLTLVDSEGLYGCDSASAYGALATAYISATCPKVTAIVGKAYGASFTLLGSKSIGADIALATDNSLMGAMSPESGVAFLLNGEITRDMPRSALEKKWCDEYLSPIRAAESGCIDDIIPSQELRARICSAIYMLASKADRYPDRKYARMPL